MKNILITGGSGLVGQELTKKLLDKGFSVAHMSRSKSEQIKTFLWDYKKNYMDLESLAWADVIVNLAGHSVAGGRWTDKVKEEILESRVGTTKMLHQKIKESNAQIQYFISASAIGVYDQFSKEVATEESIHGDDFLADVVEQWEKEIFVEAEYPISAIRISVVLSDKGGAYPQLARPIKYFVGANLGDGKQFMPWIHLEDLADLFVFCIENKLEGIYNAAAPQKVRHAEMNEAIAKVLGRKIWLPNIPKFVLKIILGEMSDILLKGCPVSSDKIMKEGFVFKFSKLNHALQEITT